MQLAINPHKGFLGNGLTNRSDFSLAPLVGVAELAVAIVAETASPITRKMTEVIRVTRLEISISAFPFLQL
jgi:hypothetical protein